jgi:ribonuclease HII
MAISCRLEKSFFRQGYKKIVGIDEVGRGALAGPILAAGVIFNQAQLAKRKILREVDDSKKLSAKKREKLFSLIKKNCQAWVVAEVSSKIIDQIGIGRANYLVFEKILRKIKPEVALFDGGIKLKEKNKTKCQSIIKGDQKVLSIAAASIIAKVTRDELMKRIDKKYPHYGFKQHKGYGTAVHYLNLKKYGHCPCHRLSFRLQ